MGDHTAFFYGTLMAPPVLHRVIYGSSSPEPWQRALTTVRPALLTSYRRHRVLGCDYPAIMPCADDDSSVRGSLVTGLTDGDIYRLDIFEGEQYERKRVKVKVLVGVELNERAPESKEEEKQNNGEGRVAESEAQEGEITAEAETYVWREELKDDLEDGEWDFDEFAREKMRFWMGEAPAGETNEKGVNVDAGFAQVDSVGEDEEWKTTESKSTMSNGQAKDPMGGRGINGTIGKQLNSAV